MGTMVETSVIIVTFNASEYIKECLLSLKTQSYKEFEVILVDNNSSDETVRMAERLKNQLTFPLSILEPGENMGFAGGNNYALSYSSGKYIALINPDTCPDKYWLEKLIKAIDTEPAVGICASKMIAYGSDIIDSAGDGFSTLLKGFKRGEGKHGSCYNSREYIFGACGGAVLYRKTMLDETGFLDNDFFLLFEDVDLNFRAQLTGWKTLYVSTAIVYHKVRSSIGIMSDTAIYYAARNSELVRFKNIPAGILLRYLHSFIIGWMMDFIYFAIKHKRAGLFIKAKTDALRMLPLMLKKRKKIMKTRKATNSYIKSIMTPAWHWDLLKSKVWKLING